MLRSSARLLVLSVAVLHAYAAQSSSASRSASRSTLSSATASASHSATATSPAGGDSSSVSALSVSTAIPSASGSPDSPLPSQVALPPKQAWCPSEIFCAGAILQTLNIANVFTDPKTIVDKPTSKPPQTVISDFAPLNGTNTTEAQVITFLDNDFAGEGQELEAVALPGFIANPTFLNSITDPLVKAFAGAVHGFWPSLTRSTDKSKECDGKNCESTLIPLNHTFVVPGGRFREIYYWDSFWIMEGLLTSHLFEVANDTLQNFMDQLDQFGFIPNGGRIYYLDRSQPPLFLHMINRYLEVTNDTSILARALPLAEKELKWWDDNRSVQVKASNSSTHTMYRYNVNNTAPRPESYLTDYNTANNPNITLNETQRASLYAELASGAETGWDYSSRWTVNDTSDLTTLRVRSVIPVCLNSILYKNHLIIADLYTSAKNTTAANTHRTKAAAIKTGILDLMWNSTKLAFYDFIVSTPFSSSKTAIQTGSQSNLFSVATFYPLWEGIIPSELLSDKSINGTGDGTNSTAAFAFFSSVNMVLNKYNGTYPTTFTDTGLQWDAPNAWPPHQYIVISALRALPSNVTGGSIPSSSANSSFSLIPTGQLGIDESQLPGQPIRFTSTNTTGDVNTMTGTVFNGGNATNVSPGAVGEGWAKVLEREMANRYFASALCSWHATGGEIPNILPRLSDQELNVTLSTTNTGNMFEKFSNLDIDSAGRGGEYTVQAGFGWTNGVLLWVASNYGNVLAAPTCPPLLAANGESAVSSSASASATGSATSATQTSAGTAVRMSGASLLANMVAVVLFSVVVQMI